MRHHHTPQHERPAVMLTSGPTRVEVGDHDPEFRPRPVGFLAHLDEQEEQEEQAEPVSAGQPDGVPVVEPLLWDGDQA